MGEHLKKVMWMVKQCCESPEEEWSGSGCRRETEGSWELTDLLGVEGEEVRSRGREGERALQGEGTGGEQMHEACGQGRGAGVG